MKLATSTVWPVVERKTAFLQALLNAEIQRPGGITWESVEIEESPDFPSAHLLFIVTLPLPIPEGEAGTLAGAGSLYPGRPHGHV